MSKENFLKASLGKKLVMGMTGLFLISFLVVHAGINSLIFMNDGGLTFNIGAHFMGHNWIIRFGEYVLFAGLIWHMVQALMITIYNKKARPVAYAVNNASANSKWYSRSMGVLGSLLLIFLIIHLAHFWVKSRFTGLPGEDSAGNENLYAVMQVVFKELWVVVVYCLGVIALCYHLLHGFPSAFQTLGLSNKKFAPLLKTAGAIFSVLICLLFASRPVLMYLGIIK